MRTHARTHTKTLLLLFNLFITNMNVLNIYIEISLNITQKRVIQQIKYSYK